MFTRRKRLSRAALPNALARGKRFSTANFSAILPASAAGYAVIVPKKVARRAVDRHRIRRKTVEALRRLPLPPALILFPRSAVRLTPPRDIQTELAELLSKMRAGA
ncbi:MAG TPA: ribonuclease P protein component [Candidatus Paceibacterota bacterium]|nr:ribonuclease P protein component [Candidatus Paceibacterota bacterium]